MIIEIEVPETLSGAVNEGLSQIQKETIRILQHAQQQKAARHVATERLVNGLLISEED